jgi:sugar phosphate isomerase/epimerase
MKLGIFNPIFGNLSLPELLSTLHELGLDAVEMRSGPVDAHEIQAGRYPAQQQCDPAVLLADATKLAEFQAAFSDSGIIISAFSCHGNPVHPDPAQASIYHKAFEDSVLLAEQMNVGTVVVFSGTPGGSAKDVTPNWITATWPGEFSTALDYQWNEVLIPYWLQAGQFAKDHGVRIAVEAHPGFSVYNLESFLHLRQAVGDVIGLNFDPSHLFWQGVDPVRFIRAIPGMIYHVHAKDTYLDPVNLPLRGVLDLSSDINDRPWYFRSVGYGMGEKVWRDIVSALAMVGYDHVVSIEHEDALASRREGVDKAVAVLRAVLLREAAGGVSWSV